jgi:hypothetical protein
MSAICFGEHPILRPSPPVAKFRRDDRAAKQLNTVQSNVTARVHALEEEIGVALFDWLEACQAGVLATANTPALPSRYG